MRILVADGYEGLSMEGVAAAAGVAKTTIYRRYPTKRDLVIAALRAGTDSLPPADAFDDDTRVALGRLVEEAVGSLVHSGAIRVLASLIASDAREPGLMDEFRSRIIEPRRQALATILRRGIERGHLRRDLDPLVVMEMLAGTILAHHLVLGMTSDRVWTEALTDTLWRGISASVHQASADGSPRG